MTRATQSPSARNCDTKKVLAVDIGGNHVKILVTGQRQRRRSASGPTMTAQQMVDAVTQMAEGWDYDVITLGYPGPVKNNKPVHEPPNLGSGWCGYDFEAAFERPVKMVNDALMQAVGSYEGGRMLFLGLGTGLGSAMIVENVAQPMELAHLTYKKGRTFEGYLGEVALKQQGIRRWRKHVFDAVERLKAALQPDYVVIGGGNLKKLETLPHGSRPGDNTNAFQGGFRIWQERGVKI